MKSPARRTSTLVPPRDVAKRRRRQLTRELPVAGDPPDRNREADHARRSGDQDEPLERSGLRSANGDQERQRHHSENQKKPHANERESQTHDVPLSARNDNRTLYG